MNICIFCSASDVGEAYTTAAAECAALIARGGHTLVWGGSNTGTMKVIADAAQAAGGKIRGVSTELFRDKVRAEADEMIMTKNFAERKAKMLEESDAFIVLAGGLGTLDEVTEILELKKQRIHEKPIAFLSTDGFYDGLTLQLERMNAEGFLPRALNEIVSFAATPAEALTAIRA